MVNAISNLIRYSLLSL